MIKSKLEISVEIPKQHIDFRTQSVDVDIFGGGFKQEG